jgi:hypothetical protein
MTLTIKANLTADFGGLGSAACWLVFGRNAISNHHFS